MKKKWPILIFSALLTAFIVLAGIWEIGRAHV